MYSIISYIRFDIHIIEYIVKMAFKMKMDNIIIR